VAISRVPSPVICRGGGGVPQGSCCGSRGGDGTRAAPKYVYMAVDFDGDMNETKQIKKVK
jgi:hypothetical protein